MTVAVNRLLSSAGLDVLVSNAGVNPRAETLTEETVDLAREIMEVNYFAALVLVKAAIPHLEKVDSSFI